VAASPTGRLRNISAFSTASLALGISIGDSEKDKCGGHGHDQDELTIHDSSLFHFGCVRRALGQRGMWFT
jgi:hypothetical protein